MECMNAGSTKMNDEAWMHWEVSSGVFLLISLFF